MPRFANSILASAFLAALILTPVSVLASHCGAQTHCYAPGIGDFCTADAAACTAVSGGQVVDTGAPTTTDAPVPVGGDCSGGKTCAQPGTCVRDVTVTPERSTCEVLSQQELDNVNQDPSDLQVVPVNSNTTSGGQTLTNPLKANDIQELLLAILRGVIQLGTILLVLALVWVGFLFVFAQGSEEKIKSARAALMWTVVGGLILLGAQGIALVITSTVNAL